MEFSTAEIAKWCGVSLKSVNVWADKNGVQKQGRYWRFTAKDVERICKYYGKEPFEGLNEPSTEDKNPGEGLNEGTEEPKNASEEPIEEPIEPKKANEEGNEAVVEVLREQILFLQEQLKTKDEQIEKLIDASREMSAAHALTAAANGGNEIVVADQKKLSRLDYLKAFFKGRV